MKSQIFKTAWSLKKEMNYSLSEALKLAWKAFKNNVTINLYTSWKKVKSVAFSIRVENITYTRGNFEDLLNDIKTHVKFNNDAAQIYYDGRTFNND